MTSERRDLDRIHVRFATFRDHTTDERLRRAADLSRLPSAEAVLLETCHRVELVSVDDERAHGPVVSGAEAVRRVLEVVAGFDSAVVAEEQLLGQARAAYEGALAAGRTGPILNELFRRALRLGRRVRSHAQPGTDRSLGERAVGWLLDGRTSADDRVLVAGTGEMGRLAATRLADAGRRVTLVSRSPERGRRIVGALPDGGHALVVGPLPVDAVASATALVLAVRTADPLMSERHLAGGARPWTVDLSTPASVDSGAAALLGDRLMTLDRIADIGASTPVLEAAVERRLRAELDAEVDRFVGWLAERRAGDALAILHAEADAVRRRHLDRLRHRAGLTPDQLGAVEAASAAIVSELLHGPSIELRRGGMDAAIVRRLFGLDA